MCGLLENTCDLDNEGIHREASSVGRWFSSTGRCAYLFYVWDADNQPASLSYLPDAQGQEDADQGVSLNFNNGRIKSCGEVNFHLKIACPGSETATEYKNLGITEGGAGIIGGSKCDYHVRMIDSVACPSAASGGSGGLSGGSVFLLITCIPFLVYCLVGCGVKYKTKGARGTEMIPNIGTWRELPGLVKDGVSFTVAKVKGTPPTTSGGGGSSGGGYNTLG
eukprot:GABV01001100.1.p1 GENE.GABV01001100.1~~GABV01001100.1.p1  ORF type:complete len:222 (-),score=72.77 GABV01001100.1:56-721(-)